MSTNAERSLIISYLTMRRLIGGLGIMLPFIVVAGGLVLGQADLQVSISAYYYTNMRDFYVGILSAIALFLLSYRGYERIDDVVSTLGGVCALGLIIFPTALYSGQSVKVGVFSLPDETSQLLHVFCGALFFLSLSFTSTFLFTRHTPGVLGKAKRRRNVIYRWCGVIMLLSVACIPVYTAFFQKTGLQGVYPILMLETIASIAFGTSWLVKGSTLFRDDRKVHPSGKPSSRNKSVHHILDLN
jgi:hypothetical protein